MFLLYLLLLLIVAKVLGELAERANYPSILGYIVAGLLLGPLAQSALGAPIVPVEEGIVMFGELGAILLLFLAGLRKLHVKELLENRVATFGSAFLGYLFPFMIAMFIASQANIVDSRIVFTFPQMLLLVAAVSCSSIITSVKTLVALKQLNTRLGRVLVSSSIIEDTAGLLVFTFILSYIATGAFGVENVVNIFLLAIAFLSVFVAGEHIVPFLIERTSVLAVEEAQFTLAFIVMLLLALLAHTFGFHGIIGAFFAGVIISKTALGKQGFGAKMAALSYGIFVPIFFAWVGLMFVMPFSWMFVGLLIAGVLASNVIGSWLGAWLGNVNPEDSVVLAFGMLPRGGIDLVIIAAGKGLGVLDGPFGDLVFSSVVLLVLFSILVTPLVLRFVVRSVEEE